MTWCCTRGHTRTQVTIINPIGSLINAYLKSRQILERLRQARARAKMFAEGTPHSKGPNAKKAAQALKEVDKLFYRTEKVGPWAGRTDRCLGV